MQREPRCPAIGAVLGEGGRPETAIASAKRIAEERGATHMLLETPELDIDDDMTTVAAGKIFQCPEDEDFPPIGYP